MGKLIMKQFLHSGISTEKDGSFRKILNLEQCAAVKELEYCRMCNCTGC